MSGTRRSAVERLRDLPEVFDLAQVESTFACSRSHAGYFCSVWKQQGLIEPLAVHRGGIFFNLIRDTASPETHLNAALCRLVGGPVILLGATALNAAGWTTQIPATPEVGVRLTQARPSLPTVAKANLVPRFERWFDRLLERSTEAGYGDAEVHMLSPEMALADACLAAARGVGAGRGAGAWCPDPDDLDPDLLDDAMTEVAACLAELGASEDEAGAVLRRMAPGGAPGLR